MAMKDMLMGPEEIDAMRCYNDYMMTMMMYEKQSQEKERPTGPQLPYDHERMMQIVSEIDDEYMQSLIIKNFERASYESLMENFDISSEDAARTAGLIQEELQNKGL